MDIIHTNCQETSWHIKINNFKDIPSYLIEEGHCYMFFTGIHNLEKLIFRNSSGIQKNARIFFENFSIFRHIKIEKLLEKYNFGEEEINLLCNELNLKQNDYADSIPFMEIKGFILVDILFKLGQVLLFNTSGLLPSSSVQICQRVYDRLKILPEKSAIIIEESPAFGKTKIELLSKEKIIDFQNWRESHFVSTKELISFYKSDLSKEDKIALMSNILAVYNKFLEENEMQKDESWDKIKVILSSEKALFKDLILTWSYGSLKDLIFENPFKISPLVREISY